MRQFITISVNAFMELIRQPVFLLLLSASALFSVYLASLPYFGFGDDPKLVKDSVLAVMLLAGLLGAVLCASSSVSREIRSGTALAADAKFCAVCGHAVEDAQASDLVEVLPAPAQDPWES